VEGVLAVRDPGQPRMPEGIREAVERELGSGDLAEETQDYQYLLVATPMAEERPAGLVTQAPPTVSIVMLTWNQKDLTALCLRSLEISTPVPYELIIVDNGSTDGTVDFLKSYSAGKGNVKVIFNLENAGFARGNNQGIKEARGEYVLLLNNDTVLPGMWLERMLRHFAADGTADRVAGMVGPRSNYVKPRQYAQPGYKDLTGYAQFAEDFYRRNQGKRTEVPSLVGFCLAVRRKVFDQIGLLEESYSIGGYEDDDLCLRARRAGYHLFVADDVYVHHFGNASFNGNKVDIVSVAQTNRRKFIDRWGLKPSIAYVMRSTGLSGGTLVAFLQINDLIESGCEVRVLSLEGQPDYIDLKARVERVAAFETLPPLDDDIVVVFSALDLPVIAPKCRGRLVHLCQGYESYHYGSTLEDVMAEKPQMDRYHAIPCARIVVSEHLRELFDRKFHQKAFVVPNWVDIGGQAAGARPGILEQANILFVGRPGPAKGFEDLTAAIRTVRSRYPGATAHAALPALLDSVKSEIERLFGKPVAMHVGLGREEMAALYKSVDILVSPSWYEGFGLPALEAMACGTPVLTADSLGTRDFCRDGENCLVVPPHQPKKLAQAILKLIESEDLRRRLSAGGLKASAAYSHEASARALREAMDTIFRWEIIPEEFKPVPSETAKRIRQGLTSIVVLTLNQLEYTKKCLNTVFSYTPAPFELIVVDNGSTDGTWQYLESVEEKRKNVRLVRNTSNRGFAYGCNQGIFLAGGDHVVLLNNDTLVTRGWLERLKAAASAVPGVGLAGPVSNYVSGAQLVEGLNADFSNLDQILKFADDLGSRNAGQITEVNRLVGFCLLVRREVLDKVGVFDIAFAIGNWEDDDLCVRARLAGFKCVIARDVFIYHFGGRSFTGNNIDYSMQLEENRQRFVRKWSALAQAANGKAAPAAGTPGAASGASTATTETSPAAGTAREASQVAANPRTGDIAALEAEGLEHFRAGRFARALESFETIIALRPDHTDAKYNAALCCIRTGDARIARRYLNSLLVTGGSGDEAEIYNLIGVSFVVEEQHLAAISCFEKALALDPGHAGARDNLAFCKQELG
jgi:GT2 family glycosyltransferase